MSFLTDFFNRWNHLPWQAFKSPREQWKEMPSFLLIEYAVILLTVITFIHALHQPGRRHLLVWVAAFLTGSANDIFFMALPLVDNFWQAQATLMLTPRLPVYICCVYNVFLYCSTVTCWRFELPRLAQSVLTGILALLIYSPYDIVGAKFLWWTWHDTDPPIQARFLGAPLGSSLWIVTFSATFTFLIDFAQQNRKWPAWLTLLFSLSLSTPLMMVLMSALQFLARDHQGVVSFGTARVCGIVMVLVFAFSYFMRRQSKNAKVSRFHRGYDRLLLLGVIGYYAVLCGALWFCVPENHVSRGVHQTLGPCSVKVVDFSGLTRDKYICLRDLDEDWDFHCDREPVKDVLMDWYTICGKPHTQWPVLMWAVSSLTGLGILFMTAAMRHSSNYGLSKSNKLKKTN